MKKEEFYFDSRDNKSSIHAVKWMPDCENVEGVVQIVHGMAEYVERYEEFAEFLTSRGFVVTGEDHLGHGKSVGEGMPKGYFCEKDAATVVVRDVHRLKKLTQEIYVGVPYFIVGHSMGSFILRNYICRYGTGIDGAIILGTGMQSDALLAVSKTTAALISFFCGKKHTSPFIDKGAFGSYNKRVENPRTESDWLTKDEQKVDEYIADEDCGFVFTAGGFQTLFALIARAKKEENIQRIPKDLPLLVASGEDDPVGGYGEGVKKAYQSYVDAGLNRVELKLYPGDRHELLNELDRAQVMEDIFDWLGKQLVIRSAI